MKKLLLFIVFALVVAFSTLYLLRSGILFVDGIKNLSGKQNIAAGLAIAELANEYPYSPFMGVARLAAVVKDANYLSYMDMFYQAKPEKDMFQPLMGRSPAHYDPFFFASLGYFLILTFLGLAQRFWAGSMGLGIAALARRDAFAFILGLMYVLWVRGTANAESVVSRFAGGISEWLVSPIGVTGVTVGFSALMILVNLIVTLIALIGFFGKAKGSK